MSNILLTPYEGSFLGPIAKVLGWILNWIYIFMSEILGIENVGLCIILFTILIYTCMLPLNYKQQKFAKMSQKMQPELKKIQAKYKNKKDQASMIAMQEETSMLYQKYGISPTGSCVQMLIQMPILFALYRVFYNVPAYIDSVKFKFMGIADDIVQVDGYANTMTNIMKDMKINIPNVDFVVSKTNTIESVKNYIIDVLYKIPSVDSLIQAEDGGKIYFDSLPSINNIIEEGIEGFYAFNYFLGMNISRTPWNIMMECFSSKNFLLLFAALMIPVASYLTQVISIKLMSSTNTGNDTMAQQMKMMNKLMPLMSLFFCFQVPVGLGLYWIMSGVYRIPQQIILNRHFDKVDIDNYIKINEEKAKKKREKKGISDSKIREAASLNTKSIQPTYNVEESVSKEEAIKKANSMKSNAKPGSLAAKANLVRDYNERNSRK